MRHWQSQHSWVPKLLVDVCGDFVWRFAEDPQPPISTAALTDRMHLEARVQRTVRRILFKEVVHKRPAMRMHKFFK